MGKIGGSTQLRNAKDAGCTFDAPNWWKRKQAKLRQQKKELKQIAAARPVFDPTPKLRKPDA